MPILMYIIFVAAGVFAASVLGHLLAASEKERPAQPLDRRCRRPHEVHRWRTIRRQRGRRRLEGLLLGHLLEGLLPLHLIGHGLHRGDPSPSDLFCRLLFPLGWSRTSRPNIPVRGTLKLRAHDIWCCSAQVCQ